MKKNKDLLKFLTCGSVDDGKSTLIGRLFYDCDEIADDQLQKLNIKSDKLDRTGGHFDPSLFADGLQAEIEQGITIDVAYKYLTSANRKFIIADTPGHLQYTRNMATAASNSDLVIVLVDASKGIVEQTRRHSFIASLMGIKHVIVAINKMDMINWNQESYEKIKNSYLSFIPKLGFVDIRFVPVSALLGDNIAKRSKYSIWYQGPCLLEMLEQVNINSSKNLRDFRLPIQCVLRPSSDHRSYAGKIASGSFSVGEKVVSTSGLSETIVTSIFIGDKQLTSASVGQSVSFTLADEIDISRGSIVQRHSNRARSSNELKVNLIWLDNQPFDYKKDYLLKHRQVTTGVSIEKIDYKIDINSLERVQTDQIKMNEVVKASLSLFRNIHFDSFSRNPSMGNFILIESSTNATVAAGIIIEETKRLSNIDSPKSKNINIEHSLVSPQRGLIEKHDVPFTLWLTGFSGSGKSTIAKLTEKYLLEVNVNCIILDGDNIRHRLNRDLGFSESDRFENIRRISEVARLMNSAGLIVICSFISPLSKFRKMAKENIGEESWIEVFVDTPLEICKKRDPKGLYNKAAEGKIKNFTGIDAPYEIPSSPDFTLDTNNFSPEDATALLIKYLINKKRLVTRK